MCSSDVKVNVLPDPNDKRFDDAEPVVVTARSAAPEDLVQDTFPELTLKFIDKYEWSEVKLTVIGATRTFFPLFAVMENVADVNVAELGVNVYTPSDSTISPSSDVNVLIG